ncbi:MAG: hypothetical protein L7U83_12720, partial [Akkermansiaceae bacterium]|nr:hypothetical protein [Akkermansiaceae bacterium]
TKSKSIGYIPKYLNPFLNNGLKHFYKKASTDFKTVEGQSVLGGFNSFPLRHFFCEKMRLF